jgi:predicted NAD/FAD-dependent oxidoreductase
MDECLQERVRPLDDAVPPRHGEFVLYWCATALRADENPALEVAIAEANARGLPVLVFQELTWRTPYASDRVFRFVLEGVPGLARDLAARGVRHVFHLERGPRDPGATLLDLARRASVVVTEDFPTGDVARARDRLAASAGVPALAVDSACVLPMRLVGKAHERAFAFRDATAGARLERLGAPLPRIDPDRPPFEGDLGFTPTPVDEAGVPELVASCAIDHGIGPVLDSPGGKKLLEWTRSPAEGLALTEELNHRYALDGRDPASYGGILWCFGQFDRPFPPELAVFGLVRPRPTGEHAERLGLDRYARVVDRPRGNPIPVLVVGAGVAGLAAARALADHGLTVTVLDKGRAVGGRLATRRLTDGSSFDHGAALFDPTSEPFRRRLDAWEQDRLLEPIEDGASTFRVRGPATSLAKHLARGLDVRCGAKVRAVSREGRKLLVTLEDETRLEGAAVILATPVPQALELVSRGGLLGRLPADLRDALETVRYRPALVLLLRLAERCPRLPASGVLSLRDGDCISRIVENARDTGPSRLSIYARETWAAQELDSPPEGVAATLATAAARALGFDPAVVLERDLKRWRYARAENALPEEAAIVDLDGAPLLFAGDAFGARVPLAGNTGLERALLSGLAAAGRVLGIRG